MTDTPRTDAAVCRYTGGEPVTFPTGISAVVPIEFARQLEQENKALREVEKAVVWYQESDEMANWQAAQSLNLAISALKEKGIEL